jgi:hypothetical protein
MEWIKLASSFLFSFPILCSSSLLPLGVKSGLSSCYNGVVLWMQSLGDGVVVERSDIGSACRIWVGATGFENQVMDACTIALPTAGSHHDDRWVEELEGLGQDLNVLCQGTPHEWSNVMIFGDFNFQPLVLGGPGSADSLRRRVAWNAFMREWGLVLHNPVMFGDELSVIHLPLRKRDVSICSGSTRHGPSTGRAIDLVLTSGDVELEVVVHNGRHCGGKGSLPVGSLC